MIMKLEISMVYRNEFFFLLIMIPGDDMLSIGLGFTFFYQYWISAVVI